MALGPKELSEAKAKAFSERLNAIEKSIDELLVSCVDRKIANPNINKFCVLLYTLHHGSVWKEDVDILRERYLAVGWKSVNFGEPTYATDPPLYGSAFQLIEFES